jgi:CRISPR-associated RAMP protein (TIGR02581 family)
MFDTFQNRLTVDGYLVAESALRVGTGRAGALTGTELPVIRDVYDRPFIPGSTLKGVLRGHLEAVARGMASHNGDWRQIACDPTTEKPCVQPGRSHAEDPDWMYPEDTLTLDKPVGIEDLRQGLEDAGENQDEIFTKRLVANLCLTCQTFGSPWLASPVRVRDLPVIADEWFGQFDVRDGVAIDRDKETVAIGPYDYEVVPAGTRFTLHIEAENLAPWQRGLLWLGVRALQRGEVALGGFTSRGLGWIRLKAPEIRHLEGTAAFLGLLHGTEMGEAIDQETAKDWAAAFREKLNTKGAQDA